MTFWKACLFAFMIYCVRGLVDKMENAEEDLGK